MADNAESETGRVPGPGLTAAARQFPAAVLALAVLGALAGVGLTLVRPPAYSASARLVLGAESDVNVYRNTPALIPPARSQAAATALGSLAVREAASKSLGGSPTAKEIERAVTLTPADTAPIVTITATRSSASSSAAVANAMARAYVAASNAQTKARAERAQAAVLKQMTAARAELASVQVLRTKRADKVEAGFASVEPLAERARLSQGALRIDPTYTGLSNRAAEISESITTMRETLDQAKVDDSLAVEGTDTLYPAIVPVTSVSGTLLRNGLAGLVLGIVLGVVVAWLLLERRRAADGDPTTRRPGAAAPDLAPEAGADPTTEPQREPTAALEPAANAAAPAKPRSRLRRTSSASR